MNKQDLIKPLFELLKIPSISTQEKYKKDMERARNYLLKLFSSMGFKTKILKGIKHDAVFAELTTKHSLPTTLIYGHYDVQPPDPLNEWKTPPFNPTIKGDEIFARGSSDDKCQFMIHIMAIKELRKEKEFKLPVNVKFIIEGEEEIGSPSIDSFAKKYSKDLLKSDFLIVSDSEMPHKNQPAIDISLRGILYTEISIETAKQDVHSGSFGGVAENPIILLCRLISKLKNKNGKINIPGFYKDVIIPTSDHLADIKKYSKTQEEIIKEGGLFGIGGGEYNYSLEKRIGIRPTFDVNGIWGGYQEEGSKTIIPYKASAKISMRLVPNQNPDKIFRLFEKEVRRIFPKWVNVKIKRLVDCLPYIAPTNHKVYDLMKQSLKKVYGKEPILKRVGGSIGFVPIMAKALKIPVIMVGFALPDANIHAPNEHFNLKNYYKGIELMKDFFKSL